MFKKMRILRSKERGCSKEMRKPMYQNKETNVLKNEETNVQKNKETNVSKNNALKRRPMF